MMRIFKGMIFAALFCAAAAYAQIYKWVDESGKTQYSDRPPAPGTARHEKKINIKTGIATQGGDESGKSRNLTEERAEFEKRRQQRIEQDTKHQAEAAENKKKCVDAKTQLSMYSDSPRLTVPDGTGGLIYVDEETRQRKIDEANKLITTFCK